MLELQIIGHLGADATYRTYNDRKYICFSVAYSESYTDKQGIRHEKTTWVNCLKLGENKIIDYLKKGTKVFVRGSFSVNTYERERGVWTSGINCNVHTIKLLGGKVENANLANTASSSQPVAPLPESQSIEEKPNDLPF
jgi:single-strand DNA-binding protein